MKKVFIFLVVIIAGWYGNQRYQLHQNANNISGSAFLAEPSSAKSIRPVTFTCDGRTYCSQMTSCAEATFFIQNCPNTKMDGDHDGVPCEKQWC